MITAEDRSQIEAQIALSKSLGLGVALSLLPVAGLGSIASIVIGVRARKKIKESADKLSGSGVAAWCIVVGSLGLLANIFAIMHFLK